MGGPKEMFKWTHNQILFKMTVMFFFNVNISHKLWEIIQAKYINLTLGLFHFRDEKEEEA